MFEVNSITWSDYCCGEQGVSSCNKPLLEKRRRARINRSLDQLKLLLLDSSTQHQVDI